MWGNFKIGVTEPKGLYDLNIHVVSMGSTLPHIVSLQRLQTSRSFREVPDAASLIVEFSAGREQHSRPQCGRATVKP